MIFEELSREDLYTKVWSTPMRTLAAEFGISDVALKKRCRRLNVPTPPRGFWARVEARQQVKKPPLPKEKIPAFLRTDTVGKQAWPKSRRGWCQRARELEDALRAAKLYQGLVKVEAPGFSTVEISPERITDAARVFHALLVAAEPAGSVFKKYNGLYSPGYFTNGTDRLWLRIEDSDFDRIRKYKVSRQVEPTGELMLTLEESSYYDRGRQSWKENDAGDLKQLVDQAALGIERHWVDLAKRRAEEKEANRIAHAKWLKGEEEKKKAQHEQSVDRVERQRVQNLLFAAEWARLHESAMAFIGQTEERWAVSGVITEAQQAWLAWARSTAEAMSPRCSGYPDLENDGPVDRSAVPLGGPYPSPRLIPRPPTMPEYTAETRNGVTTHSMGSSPFPYWLKNR